MVAGSSPLTIAMATTAVSPEIPGAPLVFDAVGGN